MSAVMISRAASSLERRPSQMNCGSARHTWKSGSSRHSSSFRAPTNSTTSSSPIASPTSRSSFQSVRRPFVPKQTAITPSRVMMKASTQRKPRFCRYRIRNTSSAVMMTPISSGMPKSRLRPMAVPMASS